MTGWSNYHGLQTAFRKRLSNNWQMSATYTFAKYLTGDPSFQAEPNRLRDDGNTCDVPQRNQGP